MTTSVWKSSVRVLALGFLVAPIFSRHVDRRRARAAVLTISTLAALALLLQ